MNTSSIHAPDENAGDDALDMLLNDAPTESSAETTETPAIQEVSASAPELDVPPAIAALDAATSGLLMPSESDEPFRTVYWPLEKNEISTSEVALYLTENADADVKTQSVNAFFENAVKTESEMDDDAKKFEDLVQTIGSELDDARVYLIGEREITAAVIGKVAGGFGGVVTLIVET